MNVNNELMDYEAAGSLAEELPWWGWLEDGQTCLTRAGRTHEHRAGDTSASWTARRPNNWIE